MLHLLSSNSEAFPVETLSNPYLLIFVHNAKQLPKLDNFNHFITRDLETFQWEEKDILIQ